MQSNQKDTIMTIFKHLLLLAYLTTLSNATVIDKQLKCLALNIYYEARSSNLADQAAVADVVLNRVRSADYPNTICKVVKQGKISKWQLQINGKRIPLRNRCQFSWFCDGKPDIPLDQDAWEKAKLLAVQIYKYMVFRGITEGSLFYHATYVNPFWALHYQLVGTIGKHKYYRKFRKDTE